MSQPALLFTAYMRHAQPQRDSQIIEPLCADLVAQGYHLVRESETETTFWPWWRTTIATTFSPSERAMRTQIDPLTPGEQAVARDLFQPGISAALRAELDNFLSQRSSKLRLRAYHTQHVLEFIIDFSLSPEPDHDIDFPLPLSFAVEVDRDYLTGEYEDEGVQAYERWLEVVRLLYRYLHPFYGAVVFDEHFYKLEDQTDWDEAFSGKINGLSLVNIFGPDLVQRYGRDRLLATPAWKVEELDDGGILLLPEPYWYGYVPTWRRAAEHLGISTAHYRYVAHLAALLQRYDLLKNASAEQIYAATVRKPCAFEVLTTLLPERHIHYDEYNCTTEEQFKDAFFRYVAATEGEWQPENLNFSFTDDHIEVTFDLRGEGLLLEFGLQRFGDKRSWELYESLSEFAAAYLGGRFVKLFTQESPELHTLYLPADMTTPLHNLLSDLRSGWPALDELQELFPDIPCREWERVLPTNLYDVEHYFRETPSPCCDASAIERCRMVREGLSMCRDWK